MTCSFLLCGKSIDTRPIDQGGESHISRKELTREAGSGLLDQFEWRDYHTHCLSRANENARPK
jgi:hypothetical protein